jgi:hypothetical protein
MVWPAVTDRVRMYEPSDGEAIDPFSDDTPLDVACDLENPESCDSCQ